MIARMSGTMRRTQRGFGLIELMVAVVIALVASLAIFQTFSVSEERKRTTTSGSEGMQSGLFALTYMTRMIANVGYNLSVISEPGYVSPIRSINVGAGTFTLSKDTPPRTEGNIGCTANVGGTMRRIAPITVTSPAAGLPADTIIVMSGNNASAPSTVEASTGGLAAGSNAIILQSTYGFAVGDWVLVYEQDETINAGLVRPRNCTLAQVTGLPNAPVISPATMIMSTGTVSFYTRPVTINLGPNPNFASYTIDANGRLLMTNLLNPGAGAQVIADNVQSMKVQLGVDVGGDDVIDEWINPPAAEATWLNPNTPLPNFAISALPVAAGARGLHQVKAVRIGLLMRSPQFERPDASGNCTTTAAGPFQVLGAVNGNNAQRLPAMPSSGDYTLAGDQRCYRYNAISTVIPLRNQILSEM